MAKDKPPEALADYLRRIGSKGGKRRMETMTAAERSKIAKKAAAASAKVRSKKAKSKESQDRESKANHA